jgi:benzoate/toluate 1,2-dioxygenase alpha subunit
MTTDVLPLDQHLGKAKWYLDLGLDAAPEGEIEVRSGAQRYTYPANWKFQIENWTDHYHAFVVHESAFAIRNRKSEGTNPGNPPRDASSNSGNSGGWVTALPRGINTEKTRGGGAGPSGMGTFAGHAVPGGEEYIRRLTAIRGEERTAELLGSEIQLMVFPGFFIQPRRTHFRVLRPIAVDRTEIWAYPYTLKGAPDDFNRKMVEDVAWWASAAGFGQPDDIEQFVRCQEGLQATASDWVLFNRGTHNEEVLPDGEIRGESETTHRNIYREWARLMRNATESL